MDVKYAIDSILNDPNYEGNFMKPFRQAQFGGGPSLEYFSKTGKGYVIVSIRLPHEIANKQILD